MGAGAAAPFLGGLGNLNSPVLGNLAGGRVQGCVCGGGWGGGGDSLSLFASLEPGIVEFKEAHLRTDKG